MTRFGAVVALTVGALLLSGCVPEPEPVATPTAEPEPTATAVSVTRPHSVFALGCADVLSLDEVQSRVAAPIVVKRDETNVPGVFGELPPFQRGALSCRWGGENRTDESFDDGVDVLLLPDAVSDFTEAVTTVFYGTTFAVAGADGAVGTCYFASEPTADGAPGACSIIALFGSTMVEFRFSDSQQQYRRESAIGLVAVEILETVISRVSQAGQNEQLWTPPTRGAAERDVCTTVGSDLVAALAPAQLQGGEEAPYFAGTTVCAYRHPDLGGASLSVLHSGAWVAGVAQTETPGLADAWQERRTSGGVLWWLSPNGEVISARAAIGSDLVDVSIASYSLDMTPDEAVTVLTALMEQHATAPPGT